MKFRFDGTAPAYHAKPDEPIEVPEWIIEEARRYFSQMPPPFPFRCPRLLRMQAKELAGILYEEAGRFQAIRDGSDHGLMPMDYQGQRTPLFRRIFTSAKSYTAWCWPLFVKDARAILVQLLTKPTVSEFMKEKIYECLLEEYAPEVFNQHVSPLLIGFGR